MSLRMCNIHWGRVLHNAGRGFEGRELVYSLWGEGGVILQEEARGVTWSYSSPMK